MREALFLLGPGDEVLWREAGPGPLALPDSRARWEAIQALGPRLTAIAHSHPLGPDGFSEEDASTMLALEAALGRPLRFLVVTPRGTFLRVGDAAAPVQPEPPWAADLRRDSEM